MSTRVLMTLIAAICFLLPAFSQLAGDPPKEKLPLLREAHALIDAWVEAQNKGDFGRYASLYLDSFYGVKRSGTKTYHYRYKDWLTDRYKMFGSPFKVTVENLLITAEAGICKITFVQTWESGTYKDRGAKVIVLAAAGGSLRIAREEMLNSTVMAPTLDVRDLTHDGMFFFVMDGEYIVFASGYSPALGQGAPARATGSGAMNASGVKKKIDHAQITKNYLTYLNEEFRIYDRNNKMRRVRIRQFWLMTKYTPHFSEIEFFQNEKMSEEEILATVWKNGVEYKGNVFLVGEIAGNGVEGVWATLARSPEPVFFEEIEDDPLFDRVDGESKKHKAFKDYLGEREALPKAEREWYAAEFNVQGYKNVKTGKTFLMSTLIGGDPCGGELFVEIGFFWEKTGDTIKLLEAYSVPAYQPFGVIDLDQDGLPELLFGGQYGVIYQMESKTLKADLSVPFLDCGC